MIAKNPVPTSWQYFAHFFHRFSW